MENGGSTTTSTITIKGILSLLMESVSEEEEEGRCGKRVISLGMGDPTLYSCFRTTQVSLQAVSDSLLSNKFHGYSPTVGLPQSRRSFSSFPIPLSFFFLFLPGFNCSVATSPEDSGIRIDFGLVFSVFGFVRVGLLRIG